MEVLFFQPILIKMKSRATPLSPEIRGRKQKKVKKKVGKKNTNAKKSRRKSNPSRETIICNENARYIPYTMVRVSRRRGNGGMGKLLHRGQDPALAGRTAAAAAAAASS